MSVAWSSTVEKDDLLEAIGFVRTRAGLRYKGGKLEPDVVIMSDPEGLSFRSADLSIAIPADGEWPSPVKVNGPAMRRLAPKLEGPTISLNYEAGRLTINGTSVPAREI